MILSLVSLASVSFLPWLSPGSHKTCDDVNRAVRFRWDANERYRESKEVGLGGGIEWALHPSFCTSMNTQLRGSRVDCSTLTKAVKHALEFWSDRHPDLYFVEVNDTKAAELIIGAKSRTVIVAEAKNPLLSADSQIRAAREADELNGMSDVQIGTKHVLAFAQPLQAALQDASPYRTGGVTGTAGAVTPQKDRTRFRIVFNTDHCFYLHTDWVCMDDDLDGQKTFRTMLWAVLVLAGVLSAVATLQISIGLCRVRGSELHAAKKSRRWMKLADEVGSVATPLAVKKEYSEAVHQEKAKAASEATTRVVSVGTLLLLVVAGCLGGGVCVYEFRCYSISVGWVYSTTDTRQACANFEAVLVHEVGHVLGLDHGDQGPAIKAERKKASAERYVPIHHSHVCKGLELTKARTIDCEKTENPRHLDHLNKQQCDKYSYCKWHYIQGGGAHCRDVYSSTLMASHAEDNYQVSQLTEDDLSALFFLYPSRRRSEDWGVGPLKTADMRLSKLKHMATERDIVVDDEWGKLELVEAILEHDGKSWVRKQARFEAQKPGARIKRLGSKGKELLERLQANMKRRPQSGGGSQDAGVLDLQKDFLHSRQEAETEDANNDGLAKTANVGDLDGDGIEDRDDDGDELPNEIEDGLDAVAQLAECSLDPSACDGTHDEMERPILPVHGDDEVEEAPAEAGAGGADVAKAMHKDDL